jgi:hypothetical protein
MLVFASLEGPPISVFELGIENMEESISTELVTEMTSGGSTIRRVVLIFTAVAFCTLQILRMATVAANGRKIV